MHSGKSVFTLSWKHYILVIRTQFISLQPGKNHSQKLPGPYFLKSKLTNLSLIACWETSSRCAELGRDVIHVIRWMRVYQIVPEARFFEQRAPI